MPACICIVGALISFTLLTTNTLLHLPSCMRAICCNKCCRSSFLRVAPLHLLPLHQSQVTTKLINLHQQPTAKHRERNQLVSTPRCSNSRGPSRLTDRSLRPVDDSPKETGEDMQQMHVSCSVHLPLNPNTRHSRSRVLQQTTAHQWAEQGYPSDVRADC